MAPVPGTGDRYAPFALDPGRCPTTPRRWRRWAACPATSTRTAGRTCWSTTGAGRRSPSCAAPAAAARRPRPTGRSRWRRATSVWYTNAADPAPTSTATATSTSSSATTSPTARGCSTPRRRTAPHDAPLDVARGQRRPEPRCCSGRRGAGGPSPTVRFARRRRRLRRRPTCTAGRSPSGAADLDGDLLPEIYFANDFGPDRLLHNRSTPGQLGFALLEGQRTLHHARLEGARPRLVQGHGRRLRRPQRRRPARHVRQQHRRRTTRSRRATSSG